MSLYEKLPEDVLRQFYLEISKNIVRGILSKNMYYELGLIISAAEKRGIDLDIPIDFSEIVDEQLLLELAKHL